jgi:hypothetical protein
VRSIGFPMLIRSSPARMRCRVDQTVVSVGPYMFHSSPPPVSRRSASVRFIASPPHNIRRPAWLVQPASSSKRQVAGVACMIVISSDSRRARRRRGSITVARSTTTTVAPT